MYRINAEGVKSPARLQKTPGGIELLLREPNQNIPHYLRMIELSPLPIGAGDFFQQYAHGTVLIFTCERVVHEVRQTGIWGMADYFAFQGVRIQGEGESPLHIETLERVIRIEGIDKVGTVLHPYSPSGFRASGCFLEGEQ